MQYERILSTTVNFVKNTLANAEGGHDWWHIYRVWKLAKYLADQEGGDLIVIELATLLHDIADAKFNDGDETLGPKIAREFLLTLNLEESMIQHVEHIIGNISFRGGQEHGSFSSLEGQIVQDADRLDAMGAIGVARTFNYGGFKGRLLYDPEIQPRLGMNKEAYTSNVAPTINHFYEKLLLLKDLMNTKTGKLLAEHRHQYMEEFLREFYREWEGEL